MIPSSPTIVLSVIRKKKSPALLHFASFPLVFPLIPRLFPPNLSSFLSYFLFLPLFFSTQDDCRTIVWKPLLAKNRNLLNSIAGSSSGGGGTGAGGGGGGGFLRSFRGGPHRLGHHRAESIKTADIAVVLPATEPDPSHAGFFGTRALRLSEDIPNPARTFSLLYGDWGLDGGGAVAGEARGTGSGCTSVLGSGTLDLECDDDGMYAMLFQVGE